MLFEDVGVTAYAGAAPLLKKKEFLAAAAGILAAEAYHMGMARAQLYEMGEAAWNAPNAVSDARDKLDGPEDLDQGIRVDGKPNIVPSTPDAIAFTRTPQQVLRIVYLTDQDSRPMSPARALKPDQSTRTAASVVSSTSIPRPGRSGTITKPSTTSGR